MSSRMLAIRPPTMVKDVETRKVLEDVVNVLRRWDGAGDLDERRATIQDLRTIGVVGVASQRRLFKPAVAEIPGFTQRVQSALLGLRFGTNARLSPTTGNLQVFNTTTSKYHDLVVTGPDGFAALGVDQTGET
jgi:hypothetical protein